MAKLSQAGHQFPQLGSDVALRHIHNTAGEPKYSKKGNPVLGLSNIAVDLSDPHAIAAAKRNVIHSIDTASPEMREFGKQWYPKVHEAVAKGVKGRGFLGGQFDKHMAGSALVAAVSPNMDWDRSNINAFDEIKGLKSHHWDAIMGGTDQEARDAVKGLSIAAAGRGNLQKAGRIVRGENPEDVMSYASGPKTHSFMQNIHDPSSSRFVTVDGRAYDTQSNRLLPWQAGRGIGGSKGAKNPPARYTQSAGIWHAAAETFGIPSPEGQAISWSHSKYTLERKGAAPPGVTMGVGDEAREVGPLRIGQPYVHPETGQPALHDPEHFKAHRSRVAEFTTGLR